MGPRQTALNPQTETGGSWSVCAPNTVRDFSAVAYHFGREIQRRLDVPVGIIQSAWAGSQAEEWTPPESLASNPDLSPILERWSQTPDPGLGTVERPMPFEIVLDDVELVPKAAGAPLKLSAFDADARLSTGGVWSGGNAPGATFELAAPGHAGSARAARLAGTLRFSDSGSIYGSLTNDNAPKDLGAYSGIRFFAHGAGQFRVHVLQPSIVDFDNYASDPIELRAGWTEIVVPFAGLKQAGWGVKQDFTPQAITGVMIEPLTVPALRPPSGMYNGMIAPLLPFAIRGAIWYQGEGNSGRAYQYRKLLPTMIQSWRTAWAEGDFPLLIVQLPNFRARRDRPSESEWAELREAQSMTAATVPHSGMSVNIDLGEAGNVHPREKREVGTRLARYALGSVYGVEKVYTGPVYESMRIDASRVRLRFKHSEGGLAARDGDKLRGFAIAGADKKFVWADAAVEGGEVVVSSPAVSKPVAVRYAWADNPEANLANREGLLASPFRTDDWPGITEGRK
jgi:sialate O-acetylesterase